jgi:hypothetical protein
LVLFHVIPASNQVRNKLLPESSVFMPLRADWPPVFIPLQAGLKLNFFPASGEILGDHEPVG